MRTARVGIAGGIGCLIGLSALGARAAEAERRAAEQRPLLVSVEIEPGAAADAAQVRRAIGTELGRPVVALAPREVASQPGGDPDLLLVNVSRDRIVLSMRRRADETVARDLPVPADRGARLRAIAWLAGNLARDQASPFLQATGAFGVAEPAAPQPAVSATEAAAPAPVAAPQTPPTEPPPVAAPPLPNSATPASGLRVEGPATVAGAEREWSVLLAGGPGAFLDRQASLNKAGILLQLEVVKHRPDRWLWGFGLDYAVEYEHGGGAFALGGLERRWSKVRLEATLGLGIANWRVSATSTATSTSPDGQTQSEQTTTSSGSELVPFGRAFGTASYVLTPSWDLVVRGGVRAFGDAGNISFMSAVGLRYNIP